MSKKTCALISLIMVITMLFAVGCQQKASTDEQKTNDQVSANENEGNELKEEESLLPEGEVLTYWTQFTGAPIAKSPGETVYYQELQERTGIKLEFISSSGGSEQLSLLVASGDTPDIIEEWWHEFPGGIMKALNDEVIIPLNDLMDAGHFPNFTAYLASDPEADKLSKNDDGLYFNLPMIRLPDSYLVFSGNIIRQDWLEELGLEMPKTIDDLEEVLLAFKNEKGAETGYAAAWSDDRLMIQAFGVVQGFYVDENGKVQYGYLQDGYKEFLTLFNDWLNKGILDPDFYTHDYDTFAAKIASGKTGLIWGYTGGEFTKLEQIKKEVADSDPNMNWVPVPNPVRAEGESFPVDISAYRVSSIGASISSNCKYPEAAAKILDYPYSEEGMMLSNFGVEGVSYVINDEGLPEYTDLITNNPDGYSFDEALIYHIGPKNKSFLNTKRYMELNYALDVQKESVELWKTPDAKIKLMPPVTLTTEENSEFAEIMSEIDTYVSEMKLRFIMGTEPLENFDDFREKIKSMNIERAIEIQQAAYDRLMNR